MWEPSQATLDMGLCVLCGGKGTAPGCAHSVRAQRYQAWLAEEIASILREITSHPNQKLYDEETIHLLCANYWLLPIYQELLHTATRYNVTSEGERKRPCSGLAKILAHQKPVKTQAKQQNERTKTVSDWIGGLCDADSLYVWFPAHWVPHLLRRLEAREDEYRQQHPLWFDREPPDDALLEDQQKAKAGRKLQFGIRPCEDNIRQLTGSIRADWLSLPLDKFRNQLQQVRKGVVAGIFQAKVAQPWTETSAPRLQVSFFLPNDSTLDKWYEAVFGLPLSWPEITAMNPDYMHRYLRPVFMTCARPSGCLACGESSFLIGTCWVSTCTTAALTPTLKKKGPRS